MCSAHGEAQQRAWAAITERIKEALLELERRVPPNINQVKETHSGQTSA